MKFHSSLILLLLCSIMVLVSCNSGGLNIPCNVHPNQVPQGRFGTINRQKAYLTTPQTEENVVPMWWTLTPDWSDANAQRNGYTNTPRYTVRTADGPAGQDPTSYVPGQFMDIVIRTLVQEQQFAGLLLYAQKGTGETGERVGEWILPPRQNYQIDPKSGCVTHKNADPKNYKSVFRVRFPPGTGTVTIKALVKVGLAFPEMQGAFYWPNTKAQGFLTLTEQTTNLPTISWFQGNMGQSCNQVCQNQGGQCDLATMRTVGSNPTQLLAAVSKSTACFGPVMKGCGSFAPTMGTEGCFFSDTTCTRDPIKSTYDPCLVAGVTAWTLANPRTRYHMLGNTDKFPTCVSNQGALWCATGFTDAEPSANNGQWRRVATCGTAGNPSLSFPTPARSAEPMDCTSVRVAAQDGQRLCACTGANQPSGATLPPQGIPGVITTQAPVATQAPGATQAPTTKPATQAPATRAPTSAPTPVTRDSLVIANPPRMIPRDGPFTLRFSYSALGARTIAADILSSTFDYYGGGFINVAAGTSGIATLTITLTANAPVGKNYMINYFLVDQQTFNNGMNPNAWKEAIPLNIMAEPVMITTDPIPTEAPTEAPTEGPDAPTNAPDLGTTPDPDPVTPTTRPTTITPRPTSTPLKNGAFTSTPSIVLVSILSLVCGGFHSFHSRTMMVLCIIGMVLLSTGLPTAEAHNWLTSPARSNRGTGVNGNFNGWTSPPCPARSTRVHAQVGTGQRFPVEWASGHGYGSSTYLIVVRTENESRLRELDEPLMDRYLAEAPTTTYMADTKAWHVFSGNGQKLGSLDREVTNDPTYKRPGNFRPFTTTSTWLKNADATKNDKRAAYTNSKYPWIVAIHKFALHEDRPDDMDGAFVEIPQGQPAGSYIVYYFWRGYYDCMDVNVLGNNVVADVWGSPVVPATYGYERALHTTYPSTRNRFRVIGECKAINEFEGIDACLQECTRDYNQNNDETCQAVITVPIQLPAGLTMKGTFSNGQSHLPDTCQQVASRVLNPKNTFVCYNVFGGDAPAVGPATKTVYDPEDPVFYHTAHLIRKPWKFADECTACKPLPPPLDWRFADKCISCADTAKNLLSNVQPTWNFIDNCQHCDATFG